MAKLSRSTLLTAEVLRIRGDYGTSRLRTRMFVRRRSRCRKLVESGDYLDQPHEVPLVFTQNWERFLDKLSIPVTEELISAGALCVRYLPALAVSMHTEPP
jgi:hypothetical protein